MLKRACELYNLIMNIKSVYKKKRDISNMFDRPITIEIDFLDG